MLSYSIANDSSPENGTVAARHTRKSLQLATMYVPRNSLRLLTTSICYSCLKRVDLNDCHIKWCPPVGHAFNILATFHLHVTILLLFLSAAVLGIFSEQR